MERGEELMQQCREAFDRNREAFDRNTVAFEENRQAFKENQQAFKENQDAFRENQQALEENRLFMRDMTRRSEKVVQNLVRSHERFQRELSAEMRSKTDEILSELREGREEAKAQRQALFALIDRLPPPAEAA
jgi:uncharacterized coiled-coil DUF342 family protein